MAMVHHHPDGYVIVRQDATTAYTDTLEHLEADFGVTFPLLPEGAIERIYHQGTRHTIAAEGNVIGGDEMPWPLGDQLIANIQTGLDAKAVRDAATQPSPNPLNARLTPLLEAPDRSALEQILATFDPKQIDQWVDDTAHSVVLKAMLKLMVTGIRIERKG